MSIQLIATAAAADAVNTISWLSARSRTFIIPVYQREYRWNANGCERLLDDIRAIADHPNDQHRHFIGSILSTVNHHDTLTEIVLIDGQQRITTLMLLVAALRQMARDGDPELVAQLEEVLLRTEGTSTKLQPHRNWAITFESIVLGVTTSDKNLVDSQFHENYNYFLREVRADEVAYIWRGLKRLEHVTIALHPKANTQQIFESLNSTSAPLDDHELIHNYMLMGLSHANQQDIEENLWLPIEHNSAGMTTRFWRHYLVMLTGRDIDSTGERGVYGAFRREFPRLDLETLRACAAEWRKCAHAYLRLSHPAEEPDTEIAHQLRHINVFGREIYPVIMSAYSGYLSGNASNATFLNLLEDVQSLLLRRAIVGLNSDQLAASLCVAGATSMEELARSLAEATPGDDRVRAALRYRPVPHPAYVLGRLTATDMLSGLEVDHVAPLLPTENWSDGKRKWSDYTDDQQNSYRALAPTLGNLALLESALIEQTFEHSFPEKRSAYVRSGVSDTRELADIPIWGTDAILSRTTRLTDAVLEVWKRRAGV